ncbi:MAG: hypothetical protein VXV71_00310 [Candidatus Thermoplasmatota archaeon]|nr:hypothetical protein [Candidatus Thermoplasmatota archaeon]
MAVVPLNNPIEMLQEEEKIQPVGGVLEDYELYFDDGTSLTTIEPSGSYEETSLLGSGVEFKTEELISDLTIEGKSSSEVRIFNYLKFQSSNNQSTAEITYRLKAGSDVIDTYTETLENPCGGFFGSNCAWVSYQINLDVSSSGYDIANGEQIKIDIEATADCEGGGGFGSSCEVMLAYGGQVGNGFSRMEFRANALDGSQVKVHEVGDGWSEVEVTEWSPTHRSDKREMQFTVDVRDAFGREDIDSVELILYTPNEATAVFEKEFGNNELKLDNDGLVGNFTFTYESGIQHGEYPLRLLITDVQGHVIEYLHPEGITFLEYDIYLDFPENQIPKLLVAPGQTSSIELSVLHTGSLTSDLRVEMELQQSLPPGWSDPNWDNPGGYMLSGGGSSARPLLTIQAPEDLSSLSNTYQIVVEAYAYATTGVDSGSQVRKVSLAINVEKVDQFGPPQIDVYEDTEQQKQIFASDRPELYNENLSHYIDYDKVGDFYMSINNVGFDDDSYRIRIQEIPVAWSLKFLINGTGTELTEQGIDSLTPVVGQGEKLVLKVEVYPPFERDAVDIGLIRLSVTSDSSSDEVLTTPVAWTVHRTFGIVGEVISDSDGGTLGQIGPVSPGSTVTYNVRITDSSDDAGTTNWVIKNPAALQRNIDNDPGYATWMYDITDIEGNIALVAPLTGGQYYDIEVEITIRQQVEAGTHIVYLQVAEETDGEEDPRYFDLPLTIEVDEEVVPGNLVVEQKSQAKRIQAGQTEPFEYRIDNLNNVEVDVVISVKAPDGWDATLDDGEIISFTLDSFSSREFTMEITAPEKLKSGEMVEFEMTVTPTNYQECTANLCYIQKPTFEFKTENSGILNSILSEIEDPEPTTLVLFFSVLALAGLGLYRRGQNKVKAQMFAAMVEPSAIEATSEVEVNADNLGDEAEESIEDDLELELIDIESIED